MKVRLLLCLILPLIFFGPNSYCCCETENKPSVDNTSFILQRRDSVDINLKSDQSITKIILVQDKTRTDYLNYILPIFTLLLGIAINKGLDYLSDRKKITKTGKRWIAELRGLENPIKDQIKLLESFLADHKKEKLITPTLTIFAILDCEIFKSLDKSDFLQFIERKRNMDHSKAVHLSNKTNGYINIITNLHEVLKRKFEEYLTKTSSFITSFSRNLQVLVRSFAEYGVLLEKEMKADPINDPHYKAILDLFSKHILPHIHDGAYEVFALEKDFFIPLANLIAELRLDDRTQHISLSIANCFNDIKGIKMEKHYLSENIENVIRRYKEQLSELKTLISELE